MEFLPAPGPHLERFDGSVPLAAARRGDDMTSPGAGHDFGKCCSVPRVVEEQEPTRVIEKPIVDSAHEGLVVLPVGDREIECLGQRDIVGDSGFARLGADPPDQPIIAAMAMGVFDGDGGLADAAITIEDHGPPGCEAGRDVGDQGFRAR